MSADDLVSICQQAFMEKTLDIFLGYKRSPSGFLRPAVFSSPESLEDLRWDPSASLNLASLLPRFKGNKVGIIAPGCVSRSLVVLINEGQVLKENLTVVGVPCKGLIERKKLSAFKGANFKGLEGEKFFLEKEGKIIRLPLGEFLSESCLECLFPDPVFSDYQVRGKSKEVSHGPLKRRVEEFSRLPFEERFNYFKREADKCIRCYACRQACPMCYCESCFVENSEPRWLQPIPELPDNLTWLLTRVYHLAGRCVQCGSCNRACPEGVDLMTLLYFVNQTVFELFQFQPGLKIGEKPALGEYRLEDPDFFWGGGQKEEKKCCS